MTPLMTPEEAAEVLSVSRATVNRAFQDGRLAGVVVVASPKRRRIRFSEEALKQFIEQNERKTNNARSE